MTHSSTRLLARHLGVGDATVARAWREYGVQPWRSETFKFSTDPELVAKVTDVVGPYLDPPANAIGAYPDTGDGTELHLVMDNYAAHKKAEVRTSTSRSEPSSTAGTTGATRSSGPRPRTRSSRRPTAKQLQTRAIRFMTGIVICPHEGPS